MPPGRQDKVTIANRILGAGGVQTGVDPRLVQEPNLLRARNVYSTRLGELRKRPGHDALGITITGGGSVSTGRGLVGTPDELYLRDDSGWLKYNSVADAWRRYTTDNSWVAPRTYPAGTMVDDTYSSIGYAGGYIVLQNYQTGADGYAVYDASMNLVYTASDTATGWRLVQAGSRLFRVATTATDVAVGEFNTSTFAMDTVNSTLATDVGTASIFDAVGTSDGRLVIAYNESGSEFIKVLYTAVGAATVAASYTGTEAVYTAGGANTIAIVLGTTDIFVAYLIAAANSMRVIQVSTAGSLVGGPSELQGTPGTVAKLVGGLAGTTVHWYWQTTTAGAQLDDIRHCTHTESLGSISPTTMLHGVRIRNMPFAYNSHLYLPIYYGTDDTHTVQPTSFIVDEAGAIVAQYFVGDAGCTLSATLPPIRSIAISATKFAFVDYRAGLVKAITAAPETYELRWQTQVVICDMAAVMGGIKSGVDVIIPGGPFGVLAEPADPTQNNVPIRPPPLFPEPIVGGFTSANSTGTLDVNGVYRYRLLYLFYDAYGRVWRSSPSYTPVGFPNPSNYIEITLGAADDTVTAVVPANRLTSGLPPQRIQLYRTDAGGTSFFLCDSAANVTNADTTTIIDTIPDSTLLTQEALYTQGGELDNIAPPTFYDIAMDNSRLYLIPCDDRQTMWVSKPFRDGHPPEFSSPGLVFNFTQLGLLEKIVPMDDIVLLLGTLGIGYIQGEGKNALGQGGYGQTKSLPIDQGCLTKNSVASCSKGIVFQAQDGRIYLLDRSLQMQPIGRAVESYKSYTVTSATVLKDETIIVFTLSGQTTMLAYNYTLDAWYEWTVGTAPIMGTLYAGKFVWVTSAGLVYKMDTSFKDGSTSYAMSVRTDWIKTGPNQHGGFLNATLLGEYVAPHTLTISVYKNYDDSSAVQTETFTVSASTVPYQFRINLDTKDATSVMFDIAESAGSGTEEACRWSAISLEVQDHGRLSLIPPAQVL